jgi:EAL and modified HD-GYP domain-containing signal transduction protein
LLKFVARQPILNRARGIFAYELLFRAGLEGYFSFDQPDVASSRVVVDSFLLFGIDSLTGGRPAFINFTRNLITSGAATLLPTSQVFVELLEDIQPDPEVIAACRSLKERGYSIVLDDFEPRPGAGPLIDLADIIKVDLLKTSLDSRAQIVKEFRPRGIQLLAEKVETHDDFHHALKLGYSFFQGFFFARPETLSRSDIPVLKHRHMQLLSLSLQTEPDYRKLEDVIKHDASLCYRLLRYMNSAWFGFRTEITSIRHALTLLGVDEVRKWVSVITLAALAEDKPQPVLVHSLSRARFHELLAPRAGLQSRSTDLFLQGLFSCMEAILDRPLASILNDLPLADEVSLALLGKENRFRDVLNTVVACEGADWAEVTRLAQLLGMAEEGVAEDYIAASRWALEPIERQEAAPPQ